MLMVFLCIRRQENGSKLVTNNHQLVNLTSTIRRPFEKLVKSSAATVFIVAFYILYQFGFMNIISFSYYLHHAQFVNKCQ